MSKNLATTTIASHPGPPTSATSVTVATGAGLRLYAGMAVIHPANTMPTPANAEVVSITDVTGDVLTIVRAQESSTARAIATGDVITQGITAAMWDGLVASNATKADAAATTSALAGKASTSHAHSAADVTSGTLGLARGGTGGTDAATARTSLGLGTAAVESPATLAVNPAFTGAYGPQVGSDAWLRLHAGGNLDALIVGAITRDGAGAATAAAVVWPDGVSGVYSGTASTSFPGAVDAYSVTWLGGTTRTVTQPTVTRDSSGAITARPAMTVA